MIELLKEIYAYSIIGSLFSILLLRYWPIEFDGQDVYKKHELSFYFWISLLPIINTMIFLGNSFATICLILSNFGNWLLKTFYKENQ
jgi:hypothetical protein